MATDILADAKQMATALQESAEFKALSDAYETMKQNQTAFETFKKFQTMQMNLQQKQMQGQDLTEDEMNQARDLASSVGNFEEVKTLMQKEEAVNNLLNDLNNVITKPIQDLYRD